MEQNKTKKSWLIYVIVVVLIVVIVAIVLGLFRKRVSTNPVPGSTITESKLSFDQESAITDPIGDINGPYYHKVYTATSTDGLNFTRGQLVAEKSSVPDVIRLADGRLFMYAVDGGQRSKSGLMVAVSKDNGKTWEQGSVQFNSTNGQAGVDPQAILLESGQIRLFYIVFDKKIQPGVIDASSINKVMSATSTDGITFTPENGIRFEYNQITDADVVKIGNTWFMYLSQGPKQLYATSPDGQTFSYKGVIRAQGSVSKTVPVESGNYRQFFCKNGIASATSNDGISWIDEPGLRLSPSQGEILCDPSPVKIGSEWLMLFKSAEAPTQQPRN